MSVRTTALFVSSVQKLIVVLNNYLFVKVGDGMSTSEKIR